MAVCLLLLLTFALLGLANSAPTTQIHEHTDCMLMISHNDTCYRPYSKTGPILCISYPFPHRQLVYICPIEDANFEPGQTTTTTKTRPTLPLQWSSTSVTWPVQMPSTTTSSTAPTTTTTTPPPTLPSSILSIVIALCTSIPSMLISVLLFALWIRRRLRRKRYIKRYMRSQKKEEGGAAIDSGIEDQQQQQQHNTARLRPRNVFVPTPGAEIIPLREVSNLFSIDDEWWDHPQIQDMATDPSTPSTLTPAAAIPSTSTPAAAIPSTSTPQIPPRPQPVEMMELNRMNTMYFDCDTPPPVQQIASSRPSQCTIN